MPSAKEPYRLEGRTALIAGPTNELSREIAATFTAAGARVSQALVGLPAPAEMKAAVEAAEILVLQTVWDDGSGLAAAHDSASYQSLSHQLVEHPRTLIASAAPVMRRRHWGRIVFVAIGEVAAPAVIAARSAQSALMQAEARCLAGDGITLNMVTSPCWHDAANGERMAAIAAAVLYFASDESAFLTGQTLHLRA